MNKKIKQIISLILLSIFLIPILYNGAGIINTTQRGSTNPNKGKMDNPDIYNNTSNNIFYNNSQLPKSQMNYVPSQLNSNYTWNTLNLTGDPNSSIAILSTGIDSSQIKFGNNSYEDQNFTRKIVGWQDFVDPGNTVPTDPNGEGTFVSSVAFGDNSNDSKIPLDSQNRTTSTLGGLYYHPDLFENWIQQGYFEIKLGSFNIDAINSNITINGTYNEYNGSYIQQAELSLYYNNTMVDQTLNSINGNYQSFDYNVSSNLGIYDVVFRYLVGFSALANFSVNAMVKFNPENQSINGTNVNIAGVAPNAKIVGIRTLNQSDDGKISNVINALNWAKINCDKYHIIAVTITTGNYTWDTSLDSLQSVINALIDNGIMVIIAAGDSGPASNALSKIALNDKAIVVGAVNQNDQLTYYSSKGTTINNKEIKPDIVAPGGSELYGMREIIGADTNQNDAQGFYTNQVANDTTMMTGTSISAGILASAYNLLVQAIGGYQKWKAIMNETNTLALKSYLLMTATETNQLREDNPLTTTINEGSATNSPILNRGGKDNQEGYGLLNINAAIEAINKTMNSNSNVTGSLVSSIVDPTGTHAFARNIILDQNLSYLFNLTYDSSTSQNADLDMYLYFNKSDSNGDPILLKSSTASGVANESFFLGMKNDTGSFIIVIKSISGGLVNFTLAVTTLPNNYAPVLSDPQVTSLQGYNDTLDEFTFSINYTDNDDVPPLYLYVSISGLNENISLTQVNNTDINYTDGCIFSAVHRFYNPGTYQYHFGAFDGIYFTRIPQSSNFTLNVTPVLSAEYNNYTTDFSNTTNWELDNGWYNLTQSSNIDPRSPEYGPIWHMLYFGNSTTVPTGAYNYTSLAQGTYTALSPQIFINDTMDSYLYFGYRISIDTGDSFSIDLRINRTETWSTLQTFTGIEQDWTHFQYNLSNYWGDYVQIRFNVILDQSQDQIDNKGVIITDFGVLQQLIPVKSQPELFNISVEPQIGYKYMTYTYSVIFGNENGLPPNLVYIELDGVNRSMFNIYGDWNSSYIKDGNSSSSIKSGGIIYTYNICLGDINDSNFYIHALCNGKWYNSNFTQGPQLGSIIYGNYPFMGNTSQMSVYGNPSPNPKTRWLESGNSFHYISKDKLWYAGQYNYLGYGTNWNVNLITPVINIPSTTDESYPIYLWFTQMLLFDSNYSQYLNDYAAIYISNDFGSSWTQLSQYNVAINTFQNVKINLDEYKGENILIRFNFHTGGTTIGSLNNTGWYIKNISVNIDESVDRTPPTITFENINSGEEISGNFTLNIKLNDSSGINDGKIAIYLGSTKLENYVSNNGIVQCSLDSTKFSNGNYTLTVIGYDNAGNQAISSITIEIYNYHFPLWIIWTILIIASAIAGIVAIYFYRRANTKKISDFELMRLSRYEIDRNMTTTQKKAYMKIQRRVYELQVREQAENATKESEALKPFILYCKKCHKWFKNINFEWICPVCNNDSLYIAYQCKICERWYFKDEPGEYNCKKCKIKLLK